MKNVMVANLRGKGRYDHGGIIKLAQAQIENSLSVGWNPKDILLLTNFDFDYMGIRSHQIPLNNFCWTGSKMFALKYLLDQGLVKETVWMHDLDAWQGDWFEEPEFLEVGASTYSRPTFNGGSIFWKPSSKDIVDEVVKRIISNKYGKEEPTLNEVFKSKEYSSRVTVLNYTYNVGCSGYYERYTKSIKPIKVFHFHPYNTIAWETHALDRNGLGVKGVPERLETILRKYYDLAKSLSPEGARRAEEKRSKRNEIPNAV